MISWSWVLLWSQDKLWETAHKYVQKCDLHRHAAHLLSLILFQKPQFGSFTTAPFNPPPNEKGPKHSIYTYKPLKKSFGVYLRKIIFAHFGRFSQFDPSMPQNFAESTWNFFKNTLHSKRNLQITSTNHINNIRTLWKQIWMKMVKKHAKTHVFWHVFCRQGHICGRIFPKPFQEHFWDHDKRTDTKNSF